MDLKGVCMTQLWLVRVHITSHHITAHHITPYPHLPDLPPRRMDLRERIGNDTVAYIFTFLPLAEVALSAGHTCRDWRPVARMALAVWDGTLKIKLPASSCLVGGILSKCHRIRGLEIAIASRPGVSAEREDAWAQFERLLRRFSASLSSLRINNGFAFPPERLLSALCACSNMRQLHWPTVGLSASGQTKRLLAGLPHLRDLFIYEADLSEFTASPVAARMEHLSIARHHSGARIADVCGLLAVTSALQSVQLRFFDDTSCSRRRLLEQFSRLPALRVVDLTLFPADIRPTATATATASTSATTLELPSLQTLLLQVPRPRRNSYWFEDLLPEFRAPRLRHLDLFLAASTVVLRQRYPTLERLEHL